MTKLSCQQPQKTKTWQLATKKKNLVATFSYHRKADK
nr:MAG TPA: hypothetical protein [Caudoviricetes sp.]